MDSTSSGNRTRAALSRLAALALCAALSGAARAGQEQTSSDFEYFSAEKASLESLLNMRTAVASRSVQPARETPGVVTIVTAEEIAVSGARNLIDVLRLVPGLEAGVDVQGNLGLIVRGNWANEGKALLLVDGIPYNEMFYSTLQLDRFSVAQIGKVEVIRGPGSAVHGGWAELAVVNIVTRSAGEINGAGATLNYGALPGTYERRTLDLRFGRRLNGTDVTAQAYFGKGNRSDRRYTDFDGFSYGMAGSARLDPKNLNIGVRSGGLDARVILDSFHTTERDHFDAALTTGPTGIDFSQYSCAVAYDAPLGEGLKLTPRFGYTLQRPWKEVDDHFYYDKTARRYTQGLTLAYAPSDRLNLVSGTELYQDTAWVSDGTPAGDRFNGRRSIGYDNTALFAEVMADPGPARLTAGARYEHHSRYGDSFVPRLALTRVYDNGFHYKALYSRAFRAPSIENMRLNGSIKPEKTEAVELETGYLLSDAVFLSANLFQTEVQRPIIYFYDPATATENYINSCRTMTRGAELALKTKSGWGYADVSYSYYTAAGHQAPVYQVASRGDVAAAAPAHKAAVNSGINIAEKTTLGPSAVLLMDRYGYYAKDQAGNAVSRRFDNVLLVNLFLSRRDLFAESLDAGIGVYNVFGEKNDYIQPYNGGHAPLPGPGRELLLRVSYAF